MNAIKLFVFILLVGAALYCTSLPAVKKLIPHCDSGAHAQSTNYSLISATNNTAQTAFDCVTSIGK